MANFSRGMASYGFVQGIGKCLMVGPNEKLTPFAKISCAFVGRHCKNSCVIIEDSSCLSPSNCYIRRRNWVGFRSHNCSAFGNWCNRCFSEADVRLTNSDFSRGCGFSRDHVLLGRPQVEDSQRHVRILLFLM